MESDIDTDVGARRQDGLSRLSDDGPSGDLATPRGRRSGWLGGLALAALLLLVGAIIVPNYLRDRSRQSYTSCRSNLKNIATALQMYAADHPGELPKRLSELVPTYLKSMPVCPAAGLDTYSEAFLVSGSQGEPGTTPPHRLHCEGAHHRPTVQNDLPAYDSQQGLLDVAP